MISLSGLASSVARHPGPLQRRHHELLAERLSEGAYEENIWLQRDDCPPDLLDRAARTCPHVFLRALAGAHPNTSHRTAQHCRKADGWWGALAYAFHPETVDADGADAVRDIGFRHHWKVQTMLSFIPYGNRTATKQLTLQALLEAMFAHARRVTRGEVVDLWWHCDQPANLPVHARTVLYHANVDNVALRDACLRYMCAATPNMEPSRAAALLDGMLGSLRDGRNHATYFGAGRNDIARDAGVKLWKSPQFEADSYLGHIGLFGSEEEQVMLALARNEGWGAPVEIARTAAFLCESAEMATFVAYIDSRTDVEPFDPHPHPDDDQPF